MQMLQTLTRKLLIFICLLLIITSCKSNKIEIISIKEWLVLISEEMNIKQFSNNSPYFLNIPKEEDCFENIQALVEWNVISVEYPINLSDSLTKEFVAYTLVNLYTTDLQAVSIKDSNKSKYPKHVNKSVALGIFNIDNRGLFNPKKIIEKNEAISLLNKVKAAINEKVYDEVYYKTQFKDDLNIKNIEYVTKDENEKFIIYEDPKKIDKSDILFFDDSYNKIKDIKEGKVYYEKINIEELYKDIEIHNTVQLDFNSAKIEDFYETEYINDISKYALNDKYINIVLEKYKSFTYKDIKFAYNVSSNGINIKASKENNKKILYLDASVNNFKATYDWNMKDGKLNDAYFRLDFKSNANLGLKKEINKKYKTDFSSINSLLDIVKNKEDTIKEIIPICKITLPIPNAPLLTIDLILQVQIYVSGRMEITLSNDYSIGMEIRNNNLRTINDIKKQLNFILKANTDFLIGLNSSLNLTNIPLMDMSINAGIRSELKSTLHIYDDKGKLNSVNVDVNADDLYDTLDGNENIKMCADLKGYWLLNLDINSSKTLAHKIGLTKTIEILNEKNSSFIPIKKSHIENWQFVEKCSRKDRNYNLKNKEIIVSKKIRIKDYSLIIENGKNKKINIIGLPKDYEIEDIYFKSNDNNIAQVDINGIVYAKKQGNTIIDITTKDDKYKIKCHIFVKE